ncbi:uncharacterized protein BJ171DRAFT_479264 [Polychytrium aggregatum]|uniref:uncharacterized protein n=1 Tax=Polychytrium aggregatum TaxID=110093 RepID=UPI0022FE8F0A|nr:uncharacterized protein BJ171DRAFT_479264 [Polychytrium aggregatum]KAI9193389.1 hypothetical protein BJ171DRAFT_479264 [Polychytrium aggregatum]
MSSSLPDYPPQSSYRSEPGAARSFTSGYLPSHRDPSMFTRQHPPESYPDRPSSAHWPPPPLAVSESSFGPRPRSPQPKSSVSAWSYHPSREPYHSTIDSSDYTAYIDRSAYHEDAYPSARPSARLSGTDYPAAHRDHPQPDDQPSRLSDRHGSHHRPSSLLDRPDPYPSLDRSSYRSSIDHIDSSQSSYLAPVYGRLRSRDSSAATQVERPTPIVEFDPAARHSGLRGYSTTVPDSDPQHSHRLDTSYPPSMSYGSTSSLSARPQLASHAQSHSSSGRYVHPGSGSSGTAWPAVVASHRRDPASTSDTVSRRHSPRVSAGWEVDSTPAMLIARPPSSDNPLQGSGHFYSHSSESAAASRENANVAVRDGPYGHDVAGGYPITLRRAPDEPIDSLQPLRSSTHDWSFKSRTPASALVESGRSAITKYGCEEYLPPVREIGASMSVPRSSRDSPPYGLSKNTPSHPAITVSPPSSSPPLAPISTFFESTPKFPRQLAPEADDPTRLSEVYRDPHHIYSSSASDYRRMGATSYPTTDPDRPEHSTRVTIVASKRQTEDSLRYPSGIYKRPRHNGSSRPRDAVHGAHDDERASHELDLEAAHRLYTGTKYHLARTHTSQRRSISESPVYSHARVDSLRGLGWGRIRTQSQPNSLGHNQNGTLDLRHGRVRKYEQLYDDMRLDQDLAQSPHRGVSTFKRPSSRSSLSDPGLEPVERDWIDSEVAAVLVESSDPYQSISSEDRNKEILLNICTNGEIRKFFGLLRKPRGSDSEDLALIEKFDLSRVLDDNGNAAIHWLAYFGRIRHLALMKQARADLRIANKLGETVLIRAIQSSHFYEQDCFSKFLDLVPFDLVFVADNSNQTVFHHLVLQESRSKSNKDAIEYYLQSLVLYMKKMLWKHHFSSLSRGSDSLSLLNQDARLDDVECWRQLAQHDARFMALINMQDLYGDTALQSALQLKCSEWMLGTLQNLGMKAQEADNSDQSLRRQMLKSESLPQPNATPQAVDDTTHQSTQPGIALTDSSQKHPATPPPTPHVSKVVSADESAQPSCVRSMLHQGTAQSLSVESALAQLSDMKQEYDDTFEAAREDLEHEKERKMYFDELILKLSFMESELKERLQIKSRVAATCASQNGLGTLHGSEMREIGQVDLIQESSQRN